MLANKQDLPEAMHPDEIKDHLGLGLYDTRPHRVLGASAVSGEGLRDGVQWLVERIKKSQRAELLRRKLLAG